MNVLVIRNSDNSISANWFRKNTFSGRFLNYFSSNPLHQKTGIIKNLVDSTISLSDTKFHQENLKLPSKFLILNGYPSHFINKHIRRRLREIHARTSNHEFVLKNSPNVSSTTNNSILSIPYYGSLSEVVRRLLQKYQAKIVFRINSKLDKFITLGKNPYEVGEQNNVVYKISCNCGKCYVGQTKRPLRIRIDEHEKNFTLNQNLNLNKNLNQNLNLNQKFHNVISKHRKNYEDDQINHIFHWNDVKILHKETNFFKRSFSEMVL